MFTTNFFFLIECGSAGRLIPDIDMAVRWLLRRVRGGLGGCSTLFIYCARLERRGRGVGKWKWEEIFLLFFFFFLAD